MKNFAKRISAVVLAVVVGIAVLCPAAFAAQLPSLPSGQCVVDDANVLNSSTVQTITDLNAQLESSCNGAQIGVLTVEYTGNDSTEDYATAAFNAWGIGSSSENNGVLILLVMESPLYDDGDYYLTYGDGFRNTTLDSQASAIAQTMEDDFAMQDYDNAVTTCARNVASTIADIYGVSLSGNGGSYQQPAQESDMTFSDVITMIVTVFLAILLFVILILVFFQIFISPIGHAFGWYWGPFGWFGGPRPPRGPRGPRGPRNPPPPGGPYGGGPRGGGPRGGSPRPPRSGGSFGGGSFGGGSFGGGSFGGGGGFHGGGGSFGGMGGGMSHGGGGGRGR